MSYGIIANLGIQLRGVLDWTGGTMSVGTIDVILIGALYRATPPHQKVLEGLRHRADEP